MHTSRRRLITTAAALGLTGLGLAGPARAAVVYQDISSSPLAGLSGPLGPGSDGYCVTAMDLQCGAAEVDVVLTELDDVRGLAIFNVATADLPEMIAEARSAGSVLRNLCSQRPDRLMMLLEFGGVGGPERHHLRQTAAEYQQMVTAAAKAGLEPVYVSVDNQDGAPRFTTLLRRSTTAWEARHHVKRGELTGLATAMKARGLRVARMVPYLLGDEVRFCTLYRPAGPHAWESWLVEEADAEARLQQYQTQGYATLQAVRFVDRGKPAWSMVWQRAQGVKQDLFWGN